MLVAKMPGKAKKHYLFYGRLRGVFIKRGRRFQKIWNSEMFNQFQQFTGIYVTRWELQVVDNTVKASPILVYLQFCIFKTKYSLWIP